MVHSTALNEALVWAKAVSGSILLRRRAVQLQRASLNRMVMACRDVAAYAACVLSGTPPLDLLALERQILYRAWGRSRRDALRKVVRFGGCGSRTAGNYTRGGICYLNSWGVSIERCPFGSRWFGGVLEDDHTLWKCPRWADDRQSLVQIIGGSDHRGTGLLCGPREWSAISRFAETVIR